MEKYYPYNSVGGDRTHDADDLARIINAMMTNGVQMNEATALQVMAGGNLTAKVLPGTCVVEGRIGIAEAEQVFQIPAPSAALDRFDLVVARADYVERMTRLVYLEGTPGTTPQRPTLKRDEYAYDIPLAEIEVKHGVTDITQANITDLRAMCAFVTPSEVDTFFEQVRAMFREIRDTQAQEYYAWLGELVATLDENAAGHIMNLLNEYRMKTFTVELLVGNWTRNSIDIPFQLSSIYEYTQTVNVPGVTADMIPQADIILSNDGRTAISEISAWRRISRIDTEDGSVKVTCYEERPQATITFRLKVVK